MSAYYNEIDPFAAQWLRNLIAAGHLPAGDVDERDLRDVRPDDLKPYTQCHFFAGIGGWAHALRLAGWADDRPVWTGSCPCQPFSAAGARGGMSDERHLWPHWFHLIGECRPATVFGEQVASKDGLGWLDLVQTDMEGTGYAFGAADLCAAGVGAPHIRQRLWFVGLADANNVRHGVASATVRNGEGDVWQAIAPDAGSYVGLADADAASEGMVGDSHSQLEQRQEGHARSGHWSCGCDGGLADASGEHLRGGFGQGDVTSSALEGTARQRERVWPDHSGSGTNGGLADASANRSQGRLSGRSDTGREVVNGSAGRDSADCGPSPADGFWRDADWLFCRDGKWRPVEPGTFPLAHGLPTRVGRLRGYGNAIVPQVAQAFITAVMECRP